MQYFHCWIDCRWSEVQGERSVARANWRADRRVNAPIISAFSSSMLTSFSHNGCSSRVAMQLQVNGSSLPIAQMGPDFLLLDKPIDHPPCEATIVLSVDDSERRRPVRLPDGLAAGHERVAIARVSN